MNRTRIIPRAFYDNLVLDFKDQHINLLVEAVFRGQAEGKDSCIVEFMSHRNGTRAGALYSYTDKRIVGVMGKYQPSEGEEEITVGVKTPFIALSTYQFPLPARAFYNTTDVIVDYVKETAIIPRQYLQGLVYRMDCHTIQLLDRSHMLIQPILN